MATSMIDSRPYGVLTPPAKLDPNSPSPPGTNGQLIIYPESDGLPMADNTKQFRYIVTIQGGLAALFADRNDVFVAGDLLWYPVEGENTIRMAPDVLVAFGRPPGDRGSYLQWRERNIPPQVVFEVLSPGNTTAEMARKFEFYARYGVQEYYVYDPDRGELRGWERRGETLERIGAMQGWVSPRLGIRFELKGTELELTRPDGARFETFVALQQRAEAERQRAEAESQRAEVEHQQAGIEYARAERLALRLRELGIDPDADATIPQGR